MSDKVRPSAACVKSFNTYVDNVLTDFDSAPTLVLDRNESASGVTVTTTNEGTGRYKASWTNGAWSAGDRLRLRVSVGALNGVSQVGVIVWEGEVDELIDSRVARIAAGTAQSATSTTIVLAAASAFANDELNGNVIAILAGTGAGQVRGIRDYVGATDTVTVDETWTTTPDATSVYMVIPGPRVISDGMPFAGNTVTNIFNSVSTNLSDKLLAYFQLALRKDSAIATDLSAELAEINNDLASGAGSYDNTKDSNEALRDQGDASWTTGAGGGSGLTALASGTAQGGTSTTIQLAAASSFADDILNGNKVKIVSGTGAGQTRIITDYVGATDTATVHKAWVTTPDATSVYEVVDGPFVTADSTEFNGADIPAIKTSVQTTIPDKLLAYFQLALRKDSAIVMDRSTEFAAINNDEGTGSGSYDNTKDSNEALRDQGDASWTTGAGGGSGLTPLASGTAQGGTSTTIQLAAASSFADDILNGNKVKIVSGTGAGQTRIITDYVGATDTATVHKAWVTTPDATSVYEVVDGPFVLADSTEFNGADIVNPATTYRLRASLGVKSTAGNTAQLTIWMEDGNGKPVDVNALDSSATASITVYEHGSAVPLFTQAFANTDQNNEGWEIEKASPGFTADRLYTVDLSATVNAVTIHGRETIAVFG